ncbi:hypothetical protein B7463_g5307, partial [Scytalidium lignicola]
MLQPSRLLITQTVMAQIEAYNEDTIVALWTEILDTQQALGYYPVPDAIVKAPPGGHVINEELCAKLKLSPAVISLMKRLAYLRDYDIARDFPIFDGSVAIPYICDDQILPARDPHNRFASDDEINVDFMLPTEIALVVSLGKGLHLILDTAANTIRLYDYMDGPPSPEGDKDTRERPDDPDHYRNYPPVSAPVALKDIIAKFKSLTWIPKRYSDSWGNSGGVVMECQSNASSFVKDALIKNYGWPENFRREQWIEDQERIWWESENQYNPDREDIP